MVEFKESLQYHNFFQKIYGNGSKDDLCYGMGLKVPRVPFLFQTIPEKRAFEFLEMFDICDGSIVTDARRRQAMKDLIYDYSNDWMRHLAGGQVECKLDGARFTSKAAFYLHLRGAHPDRFEDLERLLRSLTEDMEQDHLGNFFTKLFYSDAIYPVLPSAGQLSPLDCEFPSVVAPDLSKGMSKAEKKKKKRKKKKAAQRQRQRGGSVGGPPTVMPGEGLPSRRAHALDIVPQKELLSMERRVFGEMFEREGLSFDSDSEMLPPLVTIPQEALASVEDEETRRKREAAIIAEAQNVKQAMQHAVKAKAKDATPASPAEKEATLPPPSASSSSSSGKSPRVPAAASAAAAPAPAAVELVKPQPAAPLVSPRASARAQAKEKEKEREREREKEKEREREREREEANAKREKEEKAQQQRAAEKAKAAAAAAAKQRQQQQAQQKKLSEAENEERQRKEQQAQVLRKIQKQLEEEITQGIVEEVVLDLCQKLVARTVQGERKVMEQQKMQEEAKAKQQEDLARSLERGRKKQERKARQEGRKQETEGWSNGLLDEVVARECRELVREVMFELAQEKREVNVWQIRASMQPPAATPSPPAKSFLEPAVYAQPPPQRAVSAAEKAERMAQQRAVWSNPSATRAIVAGPKAMPPLSEPVPILHPSAFPALSDTMSISPRSSGHHRRRTQPSLDLAGGSFDETQHAPHTTYGVGEEAYYGAYGEATWQQQQQDDELTDGDAFGAEQTSGLGSFRSPSVGSESFDDDEDELEMPSTQDVAEALEFGEHEGEEEPTEEMDGMPMPSGEYEEYGFSERYYPPYASNMGSESVFSNPFSFFGFTSASADAFSEPEASLPASFAFDTPPVYTTAPQHPDMLPSQQQSTPASTSSSAYGRGQRSDSLSAPLPPQAGAMPSSPDSSGPTGWPLRSVPEDWGMDPARSVACYNVPPEFAKKGEIANFFKLAKCIIAVDPSFNHLIQFLRGPDNGCCFVQFETKADVQKALARNGANLGNNEITVSLPFGLQTSESGQRFAFNPQSRNIARDAPPTAILFGKEAIGLRIGQGIGGLNPVAPEFRPRRSGSFSNRGPPGMDEAVGGPPGSSSSFFGSDPTGGYGGAAGEDGGRTATPPPGLGGIAMLNAEQDSVVTPSERTKAYGALGTVGSPVPASSFLSTMHPYPSVMSSLSPGWSFGAEGGGGEAGYSAFHFPPPAFGGHSYFGGEQQMHGGLPNGGGVMGGPPVVDVTSLEGVDLLHPQTAAYMGVDPYAHLPPPHLQHLQPRPQYPHYNPPQ